VFFSGGGIVYFDQGAALNQWESFAASRVSGTTYFFRNGHLLTSFADPNNYTDDGFFVAHQMNGSYAALMGSIGQIRVTKAGRYTSSYTPCSGAFATSQ
jgi:hypothetical protein